MLLFGAWLGVHGMPPVIIRRFGWSSPGSYISELELLVLAL
jgi:hypothetical protein